MANKISLTCQFSTWLNNVFSTVPICIFINTIQTIHVCSIKNSVYRCHWKLLPCQAWHACPLFTYPWVRGTERKRILTVRTKTYNFDTMKSLSCRTNVLIVYVTQKMCTPRCTYKTQRVILYDVRMDFRYYYLHETFVLFIFSCFITDVFLILITFLLDSTKKRSR